MGVRHKIQMATAWWMIEIVVRKRLGLARPVAARTATPMAMALPTAPTRARKKTAWPGIAAVQRPMPTATASWIRAIAARLDQRPGMGCAMTMDARMRGGACLRPESTVSLC
jgi:hypothetical protein